MLQALLSGLAVFAAAVLILLAVEKLIHRLTHNPDVSYRWGVWLFAGLAGIYAFLSSLGR